MNFCFLCDLPFTDCCCTPADYAQFEADMAAAVHDEWTIVHEGMYRAPDYGSLYDEMHYDRLEF